MILNMKASEDFKIFVQPYYDLFNIKKGLVDDYTLYIKYNKYEIICPLKFINQIFVLVVINKLFGASSATPVGARCWLAFEERRLRASHRVTTFS